MAHSKQVEQLQINLNIFGAGVPDGLMGRNTRNAIDLFQKHVPGVVIPHDGDNIMDGVSLSVASIIKDLGPSHSDIACKCNNCSGYGNGLFEGEFREGKAQVEAYYNHEYSGISSITISAAAIIRAVFHQYDFEYSSGYRCWNDNNSHGRKSTNHMGKAIDLRPNYGDPDKRKAVADEVRAFFSHTLKTTQIGWSKSNIIAFEPSKIAPTWVHLDCRCFDRKWINSTLVKV